MSRAPPRHLGHETLLARRIIGQVRRRIPGIRAKIAYTHYDMVVGVGFFLGSRWHGLHIKSGARRMPSAAHLRRIVGKLRRVRA